MSASGQSITQQINIIYDKYMQDVQDETESIDLEIEQLSQRRQFLVARHSKLAQLRERVFDLSQQMTDIEAQHQTDLEKQSQLNMEIEQLEKLLAAKRQQAQELDLGIAQFGDIRRKKYQEISALINRFSEGLDAKTGPLAEDALQGIPVDEPVEQTIAARETLQSFDDIEELPDGDALVLDDDEDQLAGLEDMLAQDDDLLTEDEEPLPEDEDLLAGVEDLLDDGTASLSDDEDLLAGVEDILASDESLLLDDEDLLGSDEDLLLTDEGPAADGELGEAASDLDNEALEELLNAEEPDPPAEEESGSDDDDADIDAMLAALNEEAGESDDEDVGLDLDALSGETSLIDELSTILDADTPGDEASDPNDIFADLDLDSLEGMTDSEGTDTGELEDDLDDSEDGDSDELDQASLEEILSALDNG